MASAMMKNPSGGSDLSVIHSQDIRKVGCRTFTFTDTDQTTENGVCSRPHSVSNFIIYLGWLISVCVMMGYFISRSLNIRDYLGKPCFPVLISIKNYTS